jgi:sucrose-6-phosphatase
MSRFLFITDLDGTLVGDRAALADLNRRLENHRTQYGTLITYSTGRSPTLYQQLTTEEDLLEPDFLVLSVGTMIYPRGSQTPLSEWSDRLDQNWSRQQVEDIAARYDSLALQPESEQTPHKVSYYVEPDAADAVITHLMDDFKLAGLEAQIIYSSGVDLDVLPKAGNKGAAVRFLRDRTGIAPDRTVVCGDSGNDIAMYENTNTKGIIVGNAKPELRQWHANHPSRDRFLAERPCAGGILQGLQHFGLIE